GRAEVDDLVAHRDRAAGEDVGAQASAADQPAQHAGLGEALQMPAGIAQAAAGALGAADAEASAYQVVERDPPGQDVAAPLPGLELDARVGAQAVQGLGLDQREVATVPGAGRPPG